MRTLTTIILFFVTSSALASAPSLERFLPGELGGIKRLKLGQMGAMGLADGDAAGAYIDRASGRSINVNLFRVKDLNFERAQLKKLAPGATQEGAGGLSFKGFEVNGTSGTRTFFKSSSSSEALLIVNDAVRVTVSVQPAASADEAIELMKALDLAGLAATLKAK